MQLEELGRYRVLRELDRTDLGPAYLAHDPRTARDVSLRLFEQFEGLPDEERRVAVGRFLGRARLVSALDHPHIARILDCGEHAGKPYLVGDPVEGVSLDAYCRPGALLPPTAVAELLAGVAEGLDHAHQEGIVHGDLRPSRLVRVDERTVKITGFVTRPDPAAGDPRQIHGTPGYLSPEQIRHEPIDGRSDVFSLGAVLYELVTGAKAFPGDSESTILFRSVNEDPPELDPSVHPEIARTILRALAKRPENRFGTAAALAEALYSASLACRVDGAIERGQPTTDTATAAAEQPGPPDSGVVPESRAPARSSARPFVIAAVLVALIAIVALSVRHGTGDRAVEVPWFEALVRTEPPGLEVLLDGEPLDPAAGGQVRFRGEEPFGLLTAELACRQTEHRLQTADAGGEIVLVLDPVEAEVEVDSGLAGAEVRLNGESTGRTPTRVTLDLCRENTLEVRAGGYRPGRVELSAGIAPLAARKQVYALRLEKIPIGRLVLPRQQGLQLVYYVDGKRIGESVREVELEAGEHELRLKNEFHWIDVRRQVSVEAGETARPGVDVSLATLVVQAFPSNCKVFVRRPGGKWRYLDETPARRRVATGEYEIKVQLKPTGETRVKQVTLHATDNPPVRVAFGGGS